MKDNKQIDSLKVRIHPVGARTSHLWGDKYTASFSTVEGITRDEAKRLLKGKPDRVIELLYNDPDVFGWSSVIRDELCNKEGKII